MGATLSADEAMLYLATWVYRLLASSVRKGPAMFRENMQGKQARVGKSYVSHSFGKGGDWLDNLSPFRLVNSELSELHL
jgi:hypothetical protein